MKDKWAAIFVMYGKGWHATFRLKKDDQKTTPTEQLVLQRIAETPYYKCLYRAM